MISYHAKMKPLPHRLFCFSYTVKQWLTRRFTTSGLGVLICLFIAAIVGIDTKRTMAYQIFTFLLSILIIAIIYSLRFRDRLSITRTLPRFGTVGVKLQYPITVHNRTNKQQIGLKIRENFADPRPSWSEFKVFLRSYPRKHRFVSLSVMYYRWLKLVARRQGATTKTVNVSSIRPRSTTKVMVELEPSYRGIVRLTGVTIARPDPFGLFNACQTSALPQSFLILPKRYQVPPIQLPGTRKAQSGSISLASSVGDSEEFVSLRDYRPGDPLRKIHWKSWAKTDKPIIREEQEQFFVRHALILDTFQQAKYSDILEEAVAVAASFGCDFQTQESLLDLMFVANEAYCFTSGRGLGTTEQMLEILAGVTPCNDKSFESLTSTVMNRVSMLSGCICVLIAWDEERKKLIQYLQALNIPTLVLIITDETSTLDESELIGDLSIKFQLLKLGKIQEGLSVLFGY